MWRFLPLAVLAVGCAGAPPQQPRVVERVVYVGAPYPAPVIVEHRGHPGEHATAHPKRPTTRWPSHAPRRRPKPGKIANPDIPEKRDEPANPDKVVRPGKRDEPTKHGKHVKLSKGESYAKCEKRGESGKCEKPERYASRCDGTSEAHGRCRTDR